MLEKSADASSPSFFCEYHLNSIGFFKVSEYNGNRLYTLNVEGF